MMRSLPYEVALPVPSGARIWQMYNHGYLVKTPSTLLAFDLIDGYPGLTWDYDLPDLVLEQIDVLFTSHEHRDHSGRPLGVISALGGQVFTPGNFLPGTEVIAEGMRIVAFEGLHSVPNHIFSVTTPEGLRLMHTGDTQHSIYVPDNVPTDVLLINAWMNESGSQPATIGVRNGVNRASPFLTIPGHIHELGHLFDPSDVTGRVPYEWALAVDDVPVPGELAVLAWGEHYDFGVELPREVPVEPGSIHTEADS